jgi:hypothetical protein
MGDAAAPAAAAVPPAADAGSSGGVNPTVSVSIKTLDGHELRVEVARDSGSVRDVRGQLQQLFGLPKCSLYHNVRDSGRLWGVHAWWRLCCVVAAGMQWVGPWRVGSCGSGVCAMTFHMHCCVNRGLFHLQQHAPAVLR